MASCLKLDFNVLNPHCKNMTKPKELATHKLASKTMQVKPTCGIKNLSN